MSASPCRRSWRVPSKWPAAWPSELETPAAVVEEGKFNCMACSIVWQDKFTLQSWAGPSLGRGDRRRLASHGADIRQRVCLALDLRGRVGSADDLRQPGRAGGQTDPDVYALPGYRTAGYADIA